MFSVAGKSVIFYRKRVSIAYILEEKLEMTRWVLLDLFKMPIPSAVHMCHWYPMT